jgi:hypothetical protein
VVLAIDFEDADISALEFDDAPIAVIEFVRRDDRMFTHGSARPPTQTSMP